MLVLVASRPDTFHIERSTLIAARSETVFALVNDFGAWRKWSPYEKVDPNMKRTYGGAPSGVGATYAWVGNDQIGEGRMTIEKSDPAKLIVIELQFIKPFPATNTATFRFTPTAGGATQVTWSMDGENSFLSKAFQLVMDFDGLVGADFEHGLAAMKTSAEEARNARSELR